MRSFRYVVGLLAAPALLILVDRSPSDIAKQVSYRRHRPAGPGAAALLILIIPAGIAAYLGAGAAVLVQRIK
jgi:hypothetical protein